LSAFSSARKQRWSSPQRLRLAGIAFGLVVELAEQDREHGDCNDQRSRHEDTAEIIDIHLLPSDVLVEVTFSNTSLSEVGVTLPLASCAA
jgi:hypothetical protein